MGSTQKSANLRVLGRESPYRHQLHFQLLRDNSGSWTLFLQKWAGPNACNLCRSFRAAGNFRLGGLPE
jgi:hypothetical protein